MPPPNPTTVDPVRTAFPPLVQVEDFEGPLDFLLEEIRRQNVALEDVRMAPIVANFLDYVQSAGRHDINLGIEWLEMAATLIYWKSQSLLPTAESTGPADPIPDELFQLLLRHRRRLAEELDRRCTREQASFSRGSTSAGSAVPLQQDSATPVTVWDMIQRARELAKWTLQRRQLQRYVTETLAFEKDPVSPSDMIVYLQEQFSRSGFATLDAVRLLREQSSVDRRSCLFLAMLEMAHSGHLELKQEDTFAPIFLKPLPGPENPPG